VTPTHAFSPASDAPKKRHRPRVLEHARAAVASVSTSTAIVEQLATDAKRLLADLLDRDSVGEQPDVVELDSPPRRQRTRHRVGVDRLHTDDPDLRAHTLDVRGDAGGELAAADRHEDRIDRTLALAQDLHGDRSLPGDDVGIVVGMHECGTALFLQRQRVLVGIAVRVAFQDDMRAARLARGDLDRRRRHRHDDGGLQPRRCAASARALRVIAG
jgi:hypothetical protein